MTSTEKLADAILDRPATTPAEGLPAYPAPGSLGYDPGEPLPIPDRQPLDDETVLRAVADYFEGYAVSGTVIAAVDVPPGQILISLSVWKQIKAVLVKQPYEVALPIFDAIDEG